MRRSGNRAAPFNLAHEQANPYHIREILADFSVPYKGAISR